jgi:DNA-binding MarR family transcriptional regulator
MARENASKNALEQQRRAMSKAGFDSNGVRKAVIALLLAIHKKGRNSTIAEVLIALEAIDSHLDGSPHSMRSLADKLDVPYTSVSRIVYSLTSEAAPGGVLRLVPDQKDRRRKHVAINLDVYRQGAAQLRALEKAMLDYYGGSVYKLKRARRG